MTGKWRRIAGFIFLGLGIAGALTCGGNALAERKIAKGIFLVADPRLFDPNFAETVVLITRHGPQGSMGVVINRPSQQRLSEALPDVKEFQGRAERLFIGGPVSHQALSALFRMEKPAPSQTPLFENVYLVEERSRLTDLLKKENPSVRLRFYAGYAGWGPGQLQAEIDRGDWRLIPADPAVLFQEHSEDIWKEMLSRSQQQMVRH